MEISIYPAKTQELPDKKRNEFKKGNRYGKLGRPSTGFQGMKDRLAYWYETKTVGEIEDLISNPKKWNKLPAVDAHICMVVSEGAKRTGLSHVQFMWDRLLGKPPQAITGEDGKPLIPQTDQMELARRMAFLLSLPQVTGDDAPLLIEQGKEHVDR